MIVICPEQHINSFSSASEMECPENGLVLKTDSTKTEGSVAQRIRHLTTNQGIPDSNRGIQRQFSEIFVRKTI